MQSRSVTAVRWEQKASGWSLCSFFIYNDKTQTHILLVLQFYTFTIYNIIFLIVIFLSNHIPLYPILIYGLQPRGQLWTARHEPHPGA